jgi:phosphatidylglycerophosphatase A
MELPILFHNTLLMTKKIPHKPSFRDTFNKTGPGGKISLLISTWFFIGLFPFAPGTLGTIGSVPLVLFLSYLNIQLRAISLAILIIVALWCANRSEKLMEREDPSAIVIDEVAGFSLTMFFLPLTVIGLAAGFVFFRIFDILKPFPIKNLEKRLKGGLGIVADDLMAGLYALLATKLILILLQQIASQTQVSP